MGASLDDIESLGHFPEPDEVIPDWVGQLLDADMFKYVADKMVQEAGITPLLHCFVVDTVMEGDTIKGVITESKAGRQAILAKRVIDATGDADIAFGAGAPYRKDPKVELQPVSVSFGCSRIDQRQPDLPECRYPYGPEGSQKAGRQDRLGLDYVVAAAGEMEKNCREIRKQKRVIISFASV